MKYEVSLAEGVAESLGRLPLSLRKQFEVTLDLVAALPWRTGTELVSVENGFEFRSSQAAEGVVLHYRVPKRRRGQKIQGHHQLLVVRVEHVDL